MNPNRRNASEYNTRSRSLSKRERESWAPDVTPDLLSSRQRPISGSAIGKLTHKPQSGEVSNLAIRQSREQTIKPKQLHGPVTPDGLSYLTLLQAREWTPPYCRPKDPGLHFQRSLICLTYSSLENWRNLFLYHSVQHAPALDELQPELQVYYKM